MDSLTDKKCNDEKTTLPTANENLKLEFFRRAFCHAYKMGKEDALNGIHINGDLVFETYMTSFITN
ncbi:hypothetical protein AN214_04319 [Pseudoalteromonas sp. P1-9]|uniref:hypothetical protein n=1 Tax=Pseudoalteromonas sp. P1-9 TaxID=1710354 RepID=UPI0006D62B5A|nr:hypothetical protein [Pseudoalteromonas sp. P1-9]KPV93642.1 hypothetical protein AN214_04319 [Pseudoalteromonas sp. P1-9]